MNIGLISDTHIPEAMPELPAQIRQVFAGTALILHAGDLHCLAVLDWLGEIAPVLAARGNGDSGSGGRPVVPEDPRLQEAQVVRYHGWTVGVVHEVLNPVEMPHWPIERTMQHYFGCHTDIMWTYPCRRYPALWRCLGHQSWQPHLSTELASPTWDSRHPAAGRGP